MTSCHTSTVLWITGVTLCEVFVVGVMVVAPVVVVSFVVVVVPVNVLSVVHRSRCHL